MRYIFLLISVLIIVTRSVAMTKMTEEKSPVSFSNAAQHSQNETIRGGSGDEQKNPEDGELGSGSEEVQVPPESVSDGSGEPLVLPGEMAGTGEPVVMEVVTGTPDESTIPPKEPSEIVAESETEDSITESTTPFNINNLETGAPESSTKEPYMPKPKPKPSANGAATGSSESPLVTDNFIIVTDYPERPSEIPIETIEPHHWRTTTTDNIDFTISQKIDETSPGYKQLLHMLEDLDIRRKESVTGSNQTQVFISRASVSMDTIDNSVTNIALANITLAQEHIKQLLANASLPVRQGYSQIVSLTSTPSFYYIPKKQRYLMVSQIITDLGSSAEQEIISLNTQAKNFCREANVDTPPYTLGNIVGNKLGNGAILTK